MRPTNLGKPPKAPPEAPTFGMRHLPHMPHLPQCSYGHAGVHEKGGLNMYIVRTFSNMSSLGLCTLVLVNGRIFLCQVQCNV